MTTNRSHNQARSGLAGLELPLMFSALSRGAWLIVLIAVVSAVAMIAWPIPQRSGMQFWTFARDHKTMYEPIAEAWPKLDPANQPIDLLHIGLQALERRVISGFHSGTPMADLIEVERSMMSQVFAGPLQGVGFVDLTDRLTDEGLLDQINGPSFEPWKKDGRIFGLPHDVHPVLLSYRADIIEGAGIDMDQVQTWDDFIRLLKPLQDINGDGQADRYLLNFGFTNLDLIEAMILQADGGLFDGEGRLIVDSQVNAGVLASLASWIAPGTDSQPNPNRICIEAMEFTPPGNQLKLEGRVLCSLMPDWLAGVWKEDLQALGGKVKLMPIPAWTPGGRRTAVWGGTMLGIPKSTDRFDQAWRFAKELYLSEELARSLYDQTHIISPVKRFWGRSWYDQPDDYFAGQATGRMFIQAAPNVPVRTNSPYTREVQTRMRDALINLVEHANQTGRYTPDELEPRAREHLAAIARRVQTLMDRNVFAQGEVAHE